MTKFAKGFASAAAAPAVTADERLEWENVSVDTLSPEMQKKFVAMLDARKAFEDAMIAGAKHAKLLAPGNTLLFSYKFLTRGQVSVAEAPIKQAKSKRVSKFAL
jgi:hypothetical protein